ncbi:Small ubiquitin-related modifier 2, partial [Cucurbita argyrosperma subsp. sororia]
MSTTMDENKEAPIRKPEAEPGTNYVNVKVNGFVRGRNSVAYCKRQAMELRTIAFLLDGHAIAGNQTADELGMEDGDEIDAMKHHGGGGGRVKKCRMTLQIAARSHGTRLWFPSASELRLRFVSLPELSGFVGVFTGREFAAGYVILLCG